MVNVRQVGQEIFSQLKANKLAASAFKSFLSSKEFHSLCEMSNKVAVERLGYNDHGIVHVLIAANNALKILDILYKAGVKPNFVKEGTGSLQEAQAIVLSGALLHDIGNAVHRKLHEWHGCYLAMPILEEVFKKIPADKKWKIISAVLECIFSSAYDVDCTSVEAGIVKVADGTDCLEGRARIPYKVFGKNDIHAVSALAIKELYLMPGSKNKPLVIKINMTNPAGLFQIEEVLKKKISTSGLSELIEIQVLVNGTPIEQVSFEKY